MDKKLMNRQAEAIIPTPWGDFNMIAYADSEEDQMPHLALVHRDFDPAVPAYVRIHSECMTGDLFGSHRCDCGEQLEYALELASKKGGAVIYLRQEGRGIGLINKLKAYQLQDTGLDTIEANTHQGLPVDAREYDIAVTILQDLKVSAIHLVTNNPQKIAALEESPIEVISRIPIEIKARRENEAYLETKRNSMGHLFRR